MEFKFFMVLDFSDLANITGGSGQPDAEPVKHEWERERHSARPSLDLIFAYFSSKEKYD